MSWAHFSTAVEAFGDKGKPYHYGGLITRPVTEVLTPAEIEDLYFLTGIILTAATLEDAQLHGLLVGSALDGPHHDIDLLL